MYNNNLLTILNDANNDALYLADITDLEANKQRRSAEEALLNCIRQLNHCNDPELTLNNFLAQIGAFYKGDSVYICEINCEKKSFDSTYRWRRQKVCLPNTQEISFPFIERWMEAFNDFGFLCISAADKNVENHSLEFQVLHSQGIKKLIAVPLIDSLGIVIGLLAVHNPQTNANAPELLQMISHFVIDGLEKRTLLNRLDKLTYSDNLTGLCNRKRYIERIQELRESSFSCLGVVYMGIDKLKHINSTYGQSYGDRMLVKAANVLINICPNDAYRINGDLFVAFFPDISKENFQSFAERLRDAVNADDTLHVSIGTKWTLGATDVMEQIVDAENFMEMDKQSHYVSTRAERNVYYSKIKQKLIKEIKSGEFTVLLQPKIHLKTGQLTGAEALVRKRGTSGEIISPAMFIPLYEKEGIIQFIDYYVLEAVCQTMKQWKTSNKIFPMTSVNFSRITIMEQGFVENICKILQCNEISPHMIDIEMTERITEIDLQVLTTLIKRLRSIGFKVSLDDFGTEYSNLATLASIDFDTIKIDKSMVDHIVTNKNAHVIVEYIIQMGKALDQTELVAEGIETYDQFCALKQLNCDVGQGYYFSKPLTISEFCKRYLQPDDKNFLYVP